MIWIVTSYLRKLCGLPVYQSSEESEGVVLPVSASSLIRDKLRPDGSTLCFLGMSRLREV